MLAGLETSAFSPAVQPTTQQAPASGELLVVIRGLCVFVIRKDQTVDVALMNHEQRMTGEIQIHPHAARLLIDSAQVVSGPPGTAAGDNLSAWPLRGFTTTVELGGPAAPSHGAMFKSVENPWQSCEWMLDLKRAYPAGQLRNDLLSGGGGTVAGAWHLEGGTLEGMVPSLGIGSVAVWSVRPETQNPQTWRQALTDQAVYRLPLSATQREVRIKRKPFDANVAAPDDIVVRVPTDGANPGILGIAIDHDYHPTVKAPAPVDKTAMPHSVVYYDVFSNTLPRGPIPKQTLRVTERVPSNERTETRIRVNNGDPYCALSMVRE
jgi:hypothetical protein